MDLMHQTLTLLTPPTANTESSEVTLQVLCLPVNVNIVNNTCCTQRGLRGKIHSKYPSVSLCVTLYSFSVSVCLSMLALSTPPTVHRKASEARQHAKYPSVSLYVTLCPAASATLMFSTPPASASEATLKGIFLCVCLPVCVDVNLDYTTYRKHRGIRGSTHNTLCLSACLSVNVSIVDTTYFTQKGIRGSTLSVCLSVHL